MRFRLSEIVAPFLLAFAFSRPDPCPSIPCGRSLVGLDADMSPDLDLLASCCCCCCCCCVLLLVVVLLLLLPAAAAAAAAAAVESRPDGWAAVPPSVTRPETGGEFIPGRGPSSARSSPPTSPAVGLSPGRGLSGPPPDGVGWWDPPVESSPSAAAADPSSSPRASFSSSFSNLWTGISRYSLTRSAASTPRRSAISARPGFCRSTRPGSQLR